MELSSCTKEYLNGPNAYAEVWRELAVLTDIEYVIHNLKNNFSLGKALAERKARHIHYCIRQAQDYFDSAQTVSVISRPTLIYYGMISLAAALHILRDTGATLDTMSNSHGLNMHWSHLSDSIVKKDFLELGAKIDERGGFPTFLTLNIHDRFSIRWDESGLEDAKRHYQQGYSDNTNLIGTTIKLMDLLPMLCEIINELAVCFSAPTALARGEPYRLIEDGRPNVYLRIDTNQNMFPTSDKDLFEGFKDSYTLVGETANATFFLNTDAKSPRLPVVRSHLNGTNYILTEKAAKWNLPDLQVYYLVFFILGSVARYKPHAWGLWLFDSKHNAKLLADALCRAGLIKIPLLFLSELNMRYYTLY